MFRFTIRGVLFAEVFQDAGQWLTLRGATKYSWRFPPKTAFGVMAPPSC
jgi:hypothetical protein